VHIATQIDFAADDWFYFRFESGAYELESSHHIGVVGEGEGAIPQRGGPFGQRLREGGTIEEGQRGVAVQFGVSGG
jgi:hypothetical protein